MLRNIAAAKMRPRQQAVIPGWTWRLTETACFRQPRGARLPPWQRGRHLPVGGGPRPLARPRCQELGTWQQAPGHEKRNKGKKTPQGSSRGRACHRGHFRGHRSREESLMSVQRIRSKQPRDSRQGVGELVIHDISSMSCETRPEYCHWRTIGLCAGGPTHTRAD